MSLVVDSSWESALASLSWAVQPPFSRWRLPCTAQQNPDSRRRLAVKSLRGYGGYDGRTRRISMQLTRDWDERYRNDDTAWEDEETAPATKNLILENLPKGRSVLELGCGRG